MMLPLLAGLTTAELTEINTRVNQGLADNIAKDHRGASDWIAEVGVITDLYDLRAEAALATAYNARLVANALECFGSPWRDR